jgi:hypothetical protein
MAIWYISWPFSKLNGHLVYFMVIWYILWSFGIFYGHLVYFMVIWYTSWPFSKFNGHLVNFMTPILVCCTCQKNLATLHQRRQHSEGRSIWRKQKNEKRLIRTKTKPRTIFWRFSVVEITKSCAGKNTILKLASPKSKNFIYSIG